VTRMTYDAAIEAALALSMAEDERVIILGEDVHTMRRNLYVRFGASRVRHTPISESAFVGAAVGAAMGGLRPVVELIMVDFVGVTLDAVLNHAAKLEGFSGGRWNCPLVLRAPVGGWYGDGGQHEQALWGLLGAIPGLSVVVPSTPADAAGLMLTAIRHDGPVVFMEHKLLSELVLDFVARGGRDTVSFDIPADGAKGEVPEPLEEVPIGVAAVRREGTDVSIVSLSVGVHRALAAARLLDGEGISCEVLDLRSVRPLDRDAVAISVARTGRLLVVDEDYRDCGLSGELAATALEAGLTPKFARVCVEDTIPFARELEEAALPNVGRIAAAVRKLVGP